jgi:hypothetical protein
MANLFSVIPYLIDQKAPIPLSQTAVKYLPTTGVTLDDITLSPDRSLSTGVNVYTLITVVATGQKIYVSNTAASLASTIA